LSEIKGGMLVTIHPLHQPIDGCRGIVIVSTLLSAMVSPPVTVLVADRDAAHRAAMTDVLSARGAFTVVGEAGDGNTALAQIHELVPAIALVEADLPGLAGADLAQAVTRAEVSTRVVVVVANGAVEPLARGIALGAHGAISKAADSDELRALVAAVDRGETYLPRELQGFLVQRLRDQWREDRPHLSTRQHEVLTLVAEGFTAQQIAGALGISRATVKTHLEHLYDNLGVTERAAAVAVAMRTGILS
jgi:two-component system nitrate/nitrite response regulator NarL